MTDTTSGTPLWHHSAAELAGGIRAKTFSATEVSPAFLARIDETNPALNALMDIRPEEALAQAAAADAAVAAGGDLPRCSASRCPPRSTPRSADTPAPTASPPGPAPSPQDDAECMAGGRFPRGRAT
ncbi:hypothetical protein SALBM135S_07472 [Streptomyces alboniger]